MFPKTMWKAGITSCLALLLAMTSTPLQQWTSPAHRPWVVTAPEDPTGWLQNKQGLWLYTREWTPVASPPTGIVFVLHGFGEHSDRFGYHNLASHLTAEGYLVVAMDHQGLGRSNGDRGFVQFFNDYVDDFMLLVQRYVDRWPSLPKAIVGHDLGGGIALQAALHNNDTFAALALSAPLVRPDPDVHTPFVMAVYHALSWMPRMLIERREHARTRLFCRNETVRLQFLADELIELGIPLGTSIQLLKAGEYLRDHAHQLVTPTLVMHGTHDLIMKPDGTRDFFNAISTPSDLRKLVAFSDVHHDLFEESVRDEAARHVLAFFNRVLSIS